MDSHFLPTLRGLPGPSALEWGDSAHECGPHKAASFCLPGQYSAGAPELLALERQGAINLLGPSAAGLPALGPFRATDSDRANLGYGAPRVKPAGPWQEVLPIDLTNASCLPLCQALAGHQATQSPPP